MSDSTAVFDVIDSIGKWWFRVKNNRGEITVDYKGKINYNQSTTRTKLVICQPSTTIEYDYERDYIDANYDRGVIIVSDGGLIWKFYKNGVADTTLIFGCQILCDSSYPLGTPVPHTDHTNLHNYMIWLDHQPHQIKMDNASKLMVAVS